jgi:hypothetical protein
MRNYSINPERNAGTHQPTDGRLEHECSFCEAKGAGFMRNLLQIKIHSSLFIGAQTSSSCSGKKLIELTLDCPC